MLFYRAALLLSSRTLTFRVRPHPPPPGLDRVVLAETEPRTAGATGPGLPAEGETFAELAAGFAVGTTTAWRYVNETVALLVGRMPELRAAGLRRRAG